MSGQSISGHTLPPYGRKDVTTGITIFLSWWVPLVWADITSFLRSDRGPGSCFLVTQFKARQLLVNPRNGDLSMWLLMHVQVLIRLVMGILLTLGSVHQLGVKWFFLCSSSTNHLHGWFMNSFYQIRSRVMHLIIDWITLIRVRLRTCDVREHTKSPSFLQNIWRWSRVFRG